MPSNAHVTGVLRSGTDPIFPWNPYQDQVDCRITDEIIHVTVASNGKTQYMPRNAPFFTKNVVIKPFNGGDPLVLGRDYIFANPFNEFINKYPRNVFGSVIFLNQKTDADFKMSYDTVGYPFALDDGKYAEAVNNMYELPRTSKWSDLINIPGSFPPPPHEEDINETYDYTEMMDYLYQMVHSLGLMVDANIAAIKDQLTSPTTGIKSASATPTNTGADYQVATKADIGNSQSLNKLMTIGTTVELLQKVASGEIKIKY